MNKIISLMLLVVLVNVTHVSTLSAAEQVAVYSARKEALIKPVLDVFTQQTGIEVKLITGKADALLTRLKLEGAASPADVFITTDVARLQRAKEADVLQKLESNVLNQRIPENLRDEQGYWHGLSLRARPIFYAKGKVTPAELSSYEDLVDQKWSKRVCIRSSSNVYNQSLVASMIESGDQATVLAWIKGIVSNFARKPAGGDTDQIKAVAAGVCDVAIANTYYYGRLINSDKADKRAIAEKVGIFWPNQEGRGTHVNVSGAGVLKHAKNKENAKKLIEFLASDSSQKWYSAVNNEYPVVKGVPMSETLTAWGEFKSDTVNLSKLGELNRTAVKLMDQGGWK